MHPHDRLDTYRSAFSAHRSRIVTSATIRIQNIYTRAVEKYGPTLRGVYNDPAFAQVWRETVSRCVKRTGHMMNDPVNLDEDLIRTLVEAWADQEIDGAVHKLDAKIGDVTSVRVLEATDGLAWFTVSAELPDGRLIRVYQTQILNVSSKGKLFNQWPATMYVNGKKTSEAAYKKTLAVQI